MILPEALAQLVDIFLRCSSSLAGQHGGEIARGELQEKEVEDDDTEHDWLSDAVVKPLTDIMVKALGATGDGMVRSMEVLSRPEQLFGSVELARTGYQVVSDVAALALMPDDSPTRLKGKLAGRKRVAWNQPLPLDAVKMIGKALNCSINAAVIPTK